MAFSEQDRIRDKVNSRANFLITEEVEADVGGGLVGETMTSHSGIGILQSTSAQIGS